MRNSFSYNEVKEMSHYKIGQAIYEGLTVANKVHLKKETGNFSQRLIDLGAIYQRSAEKYATAYSDDDRQYMEFNLSYETLKMSAEFTEKYIEWFNKLK